MRKPVESLLVRAVLLLGAVTLLELGAVLGEGDLESPMCEAPAIPSIATLLGSIEILEADRQDALGFLIEERDIGDVSDLLSLIAHVVLDVEVGGLILLEFLKREGMLDDADLGPLVPPRREGYGDFFFVIRPLS